MGFKSQVCYPLSMSLKPPKKVPQPLNISFLFVKLEIMMFFLSACNQECDVAYMKWLCKPVTTKINYNVYHELRDCHKRFYKKYFTMYLVFFFPFHLYMCQILHWVIRSLKPQRAYYILSCYSLDYTSLDTQRLY